MNYRPGNWVYLVVVLAALIFNRGFIGQNKWDAIASTSPDAEAARYGYQQNTSFLGGLDCWRGPWIARAMTVNSYWGGQRTEPTTPRFRPLASHWLWLQCWVGEKLGWDYSGWTNFALFAASCCALTGLVWRWTDDERWGLAAGLAAAGHTLFADRRPLEWLNCFPLSPSLLALLGLLLSLLSFEAWLDDRRRWLLIPAWAGAVLGLLCHEFAALAPFMWLISTCIWWVDLKGDWTALWTSWWTGKQEPLWGENKGKFLYTEAVAHVASLTMLVGVFFAYRKRVLDGAPPLWSWRDVWRDFALGNPLVGLYQTQQWAPLLLLALCGGGYVVWRRKLLSPGVFGRIAILTVLLSPVAGMAIWPEQLWRIIDQPTELIWQLAMSLWFLWSFYLVWRDPLVLKTWILLGLVNLLYAGQSRHASLFLTPLWMWAWTHAVIVTWATVRALEPAREWIELRKARHRTT